MTEKMLKAITEAQVMKTLKTTKMKKMMRMTSLKKKMASSTTSSTNKESWLAKSGLSMSSFCPKNKEMTK